jgi:type II secretory pathway pseudopilin PulG
MRYVQTNRSRRAESGYVLLAVMLTLTLMLVAMAIEAPRIAQQIKREKEEELVHRGKDYAMAVKRFVHKSGGRYPASIEQLENTNHIRFLRKKYKDPMTGETDWKMVHAGEAQIKIPTPNPGLPGSGNPGLSGSSTNPGLSDSTNTGSSGTTTGTTSLAGTTQTVSGGSGLGQTLTQPGTNGSLGSLTTSNTGNGQTFGGGQIIGVASVSKKQAIKEFNDKDHYDEWYFVYDLRLEQSGGTGVAVAAPMVPGSGGGNPGGGGGNPTGQQAPAAGNTNDQVPATGTAPGQPQPTGTPTQTPPQPPPNQN